MCCSKFALNLEVDLEKDPRSFGGASENRKCTDILGLIVMVLYLGVVIGLTVYCSLNSDIDKYLKGYDDCGNICGRDNIETDSITYECFGKNMAGKGTLLLNDPVSGTERICSNLCGGPYCTVIGYDKNFVPIKMVLKSEIHIIAWTALGGILITYGIYSVLGKSKLKCIFNCLLVIFSVLLACMLWVIFVHFDTYLKNVHFILYTILAIFATSATLASICIVPFLCIKRMSLKFELTQKLINETLESLNELKLKYLLPSLSFITIALLLIILNVGLLFVSSFSHLEKVDEDIKGQPILDYLPYQIAKITEWLLIFAFLLLYEFVSNFQCMIVGGTVAQWYFTRRNDELTKPIRTTIKNIFKYHFGTLCWSAVIQSITFPIQIVMNILSITINVITFRETMYSCLRRNLSETNFRIFLTCCGFITRNGLIMTAIHGCNFSAGTIRAGKLLSQNMFNASSIFAFGNWFFIISKYMVFCFIFSSSNIVRLPSANTFFVNLFIIKVGLAICCCIFADCFFSVLTVTQKTLFLCFCEDCFYNDKTQIKKPYNMSPQFAQYIENVNIFVDAKYWETISSEWGKGPKKLYVKKRTLI